MNFNPDEPRDARGRWTAGASDWRDKPLFDKSFKGRATSLAMHALLSVPGPFRRRPGWADPDKAARLGRLLPQWAGADGLDDDSFQDRYLGRGVSQEAVRRLRTAVGAAVRARTAGDMASAGAHLADAMRAIGIDDWLRFLKAAEVRSATNGHGGQVQLASAVAIPSWAWKAAGAEVIAGGGPEEPVGDIIAAITLGIGLGAAVVHHEEPDHDQPVPQLDGSGKTHGEIPDHVPDSWTDEELEELKADLAKSIENRQEEQQARGEDPPHRDRINQEIRLLRQVERRLGRQR